jgi:hypothetical protein
MYRLALMQSGTRPTDEDVFDATTRPLIELIIASKRSQRQPARSDYRKDSEPWVNAMRESLQLNPQLSMFRAYRFAVAKLGQPPGKGKPESKRARIIRLYRARYGSHKRP